MAGQALYLDDLFSFFEIEPEIASPADPVPVPRPITRGFVFENVGFRYPDAERWAVRHLDFALRAGEVLPQSVLGYLAEAYHLAGRPADADRANTGYARATLHDESPSLRGRQPSRRRGGDEGMGMF